MAKEYKDLVVGLDIGTAKVMVVVAEVVPGGKLKLAGLGVAPSTGIRRGVVVNIDATVQSIQLALKEAELATLTDVLALPADLADAAAAPDLVGQVVARFGRLDALINCAGATRRGTLLDLADGDWQHGFAVKFFGTIALTRAAWPHLAEAKGSVITIAGALAHSPSESSLIGGTICAALLNFNKGLAETGRRDGVRVNAINPGWIDTGRLDSLLQQRARDAGPAAVGASTTAAPSAAAPTTAAKPVAAASPPGASDPVDQLGKGTPERSVGGTTSITISIGSVRALTQLNGLANPNMIRAGQTLCIQ